MLITVLTKTYSYRRPIVLAIGFTLVFVLVLTLFISSGCCATNHEGFAIYLTKEDIPPDRMEALSHIDIADQPVISIKDIIKYNAQTHEMLLSASAFAGISELDVPVRGKSFMVCVDRNPIYWGAFWTPYSSMSFDGVTIWKPLLPQEPGVIALEMGYPFASFYEGEDPRNNPVILNSLKQAGKLITKLPHSLKGYELEKK